MMLTIPTRVSFLLKVFALSVICGEQVFVRGTDSGEYTLCTVFFKLVVQGLREIGVSYCVHKMTTGECLH